MDHLDECKQDVVVAAQEEREAQRALAEGRGPMNEDRSAEEADEYRLRLEQWRSASHVLVEALDRLERAQRALEVRRAPHDDSPATS